MKPETSVRVNWASMGLVLGAVIAVLVGLNTKLLVSKNESEKMVSSTLLKARVAICVAQFANAPQYQEKLKEFKALNFLSRDGYIEKGGWDKMPGEQKASDGVNRVCGDKIAESAEK